MKVLMLCGVFAKENEQEVINNAKAAVEFSANLFQQKLIAGFKSINCDFSVISAPFIGSYPNASRIVNFSGFSEPQESYTYISFNNIWGIRNFSRAASLKKAVRSFIEHSEEEKLILVYCPHTPFLEAAVYAKKADPRIRICLYTPDLPQYMNLSAKRSLIYDIAKKFDIAVMTRLMHQVDSFVLLTEQMKNLLPVENKPYRVIEGIISELPDSIPSPNADDSKKYIVYTGKINKKFGVKHLIDAFSNLEDPDCRLILCGRGDCESYAAKASAKDPRIIPLGQVSPDEAKAWQRRAAVLVNPRANEGEYTKYSFPSKIIEYILTGRPVAAYMLDGMPECYRDFIYEINSNLPPVEAIGAALQTALESDAYISENKASLFLTHARQTLLADNIARTIVEISSKS